MKPDHFIASCINSYYFFFRNVWHLLSDDEFMRSNHIVLIASRLEYIGKTIAQRLPSPDDTIINVPPGSSKSSLVSHAWLPWIWLHRPSVGFLQASYSHSISIKHSVKANHIVNSDFYKIFQPYFQAKFGKPFELIKDTEQDWQNNFNGSYFATSVGGAVTGNHYDIHAYDDLLNPELSVSEAANTRTNRYTDRTLSNRIKNRRSHAKLWIMQRLGEKDPTAHRLAKKKDVFHINLPARLNDSVKPEGFKKHYTNGLLDPIRLSEQILSEYYDELGSYGFNSQYLQDPKGEDGLHIKKEWIQVSERMPQGVWEVWVDGAFTDKKNNDPSGVMLACQQGGKIYIRDFVEVRKELPDFVKWMQGYFTRMALPLHTKVYIEPKASGQSVIPALKTYAGINAVQIGNGKLIAAGKMQRLNIAAPAIEAGRILFVDGVWNNRLTEQLISFPHGDHDEGVDLLGYITDYYSRNKNSSTFVI